MTWPVSRSAQRIL